MNWEKKVMMWTIQQYTEIFQKKRKENCQFWFHDDFKYALTNEGEYLICPSHKATLNLFFYWPCSLYVSILNI